LTSFEKGGSSAVKLSSVWGRAPLTREKEGLLRERTVREPEKGLSYGKRQKAGKRRQKKRKKKGVRKAIRVQISGLLVTQGL